MPSNCFTRLPTLPWLPERELMGTVEAGREEEALRATLRGDSSTVMGLRLAMLMGWLVMLMGLTLVMLGIAPTMVPLLPTMPAETLTVSGVSARMLRKRS